MSDDPLEQAIAAAQDAPASVRPKPEGLQEKIDELVKASREFGDAVRSLGSIRALEWRPIETAPRGGMELLLWVPTGGWHIGFFNDETRQWDDGDYMDDLRPTHWMPLPEPPE